jgi:hypothetical protein
VIRLPRLPDAAADGWRTLFQLTERHGDAWTLIGAQMVLAHAYEHGVAPPRASLDFDVLANVRMATAGGTETISRTLASLNFELDPPTPDGLSHRFRQGAVVIDVLAPDGLGERTPRTTLPPAHTLMVRGGTRALQRSETIEVALGSERGRVRRPDLLGALVVKAAAVGVDDVPRAQEQDFAFLLSLVESPERFHLTDGDRRQLRERRDLLLATHGAYAGLSADRALVARRALAALIR